MNALHKPPWWKEKRPYGHRSPGSHWCGRPQPGGRMLMTSCQPRERSQRVPAYRTSGFSARSARPWKDELVVTGHSFCCRAVSAEDCTKCSGNFARHWKVAKLPGVSGGRSTSIRLSFFSVPFKIRNGDGPRDGPQWGPSRGPSPLSNLPATFF